MTTQSVVTRRNWLRSGVFWFLGAMLSVLREHEKPWHARMLTEYREHGTRRKELTPFPREETYHRNFPGASRVDSNPEMLLISFGMIAENHTFAKPPRSGAVREGRSGMEDSESWYDLWMKGQGDQEADPLIRQWLQAASSGNTAAMIELLDSGIDVNTRGHYGPNALIWAVWVGHIETIRVLLDRGIDLTFEYGTEETALTHAIRRSLPEFQRVPDPEPMKLLSEAGARYNLIDALLINDIEMARTRLEEGADPNYGTNSYLGPLLMEMARIGNVPMIDLLLDYGANIDATDDLGRTSLQNAAQEGQTQAVFRLLERRADPDHGWPHDSPLANAAAKGFHDIVELLLDRRAKRGIIDALVLNDETILNVMLDQELRNIRSHDWPLDLPGTASYVDFLGTATIRIAMVAAGHGSLNVLHLMLDHGAKHLVGWDPHTLLAEAARHGHLDVMKLLLDRGANLEAVGHDGLTPLAWAIREGQDEAANWLRQAGALG